MCEEWQLSCFKIFIEKIKILNNFQSKTLFLSFSQPLTLEQHDTIC